MKHDRIFRQTWKTRNGHNVSVFFNQTTGLFVADLNHKAKAGGFEFVRRTLDERSMLRHCRNLPGWDAEETD